MTPGAALVCRYCKQMVWDCLGLVPGCRNYKPKPSDAEKFATVFRAASRGILRGITRAKVWHIGNFTDAQLDEVGEAWRTTGKIETPMLSYDLAGPMPSDGLLMADAFAGIADVFEKMVEAERSSIPD